MTAPDWQTRYEAERTARLDAEARLRGLRWWLAMVVVLGVTMLALAGCLRATTEASRAVARWEVSDGR